MQKYMNSRRMDSSALVQQISGNYKVISLELWDFYIATLKRVVSKTNIVFYSSNVHRVDMKILVQIKDRNT